MSIRVRACAHTRGLKQEDVSATVHEMVSTRGCFLSRKALSRRNMHSASNNPKSDPDCRQEREPKDWVLNDHSDISSGQRLRSASFGRLRSLIERNAHANQDI